MVRTPRSPPKNAATRSSSNPAKQHCSTVHADARGGGTQFGLVIPLSRSLVEKARGCDIDFLRCSFRLFPFKPHDGEMPSPKIGSFPGFFDRSIRPEPPSAATRITNRLEIKLQFCSEGTGYCDTRGRGSGCGLMTSLSRSLVGKARGCDVDFLRCSFRPLVPVTVSRGRNAISENRVAPRLFRPFHQVRTALRGHSHHK